MRALTMAAILAGAAVAVTPVGAQETGVEAQFAQCVVEQDADQARAIKDAPSQEAFVAEFKKGVEICPVDVEQMSMGRFFTALNELLADEADTGNPG